MTGDPHPPMLEFEDVDALTSRVFHAWRRSIQLQRQLMLKTLAQKGASHGEAFCLRMLTQNDGVSQRDLAQMLHLSRPWVTKMLQALEREGSVVRRSDSDDQRLTRVYITPAGRKRDRELHADLAAHVNSTIGALSEADRLELARLLDEVAERTAGLLVEAGDTAP